MGLKKNYPHISEALRLTAQEVQTISYLNEGFITPAQLNGQGLYLDQYTKRSEALLVDTGNKITAARMIHTEKRVGIMSLPTPKKFSLDSDAVQKIAGVNRLADIRYRDVVEISGLGSLRSQNGEPSAPAESFDATRQVYATALRRSLDQGHKLWVMNIEERLKNQLTTFLGKGVISQVGEPRAQMGPATMPVAVNPQQVVESILDGNSARFDDMNRADIAKALRGVSERYLPPRLVRKLHASGIETTQDTLLSRALRHKKALLYGAIIGYAALRAIPVAALPEFEGSPFIFAGVDISTALTQVWGMERYLTGRSRLVRAVGATTAVASLVAPYVYVYANGEDYPVYVNVIVGGLIGGAIVSEVIKTRKDIAIRRGLRASELPVAAVPA